MYKVKVSIEGSSPLLMHKFNDGLKFDKNLTDEEMAELVAYRNNEGKLYQPSDHLIGALVKAGTNFKVGGRGKKTFKEFIKGGVFIYPDAIIHKNQNYEIDKRRVVVNRSAIMRVRPMLNIWSLDFELQILSNEITFEEMNKIMVYAGEYIGIGDFRPRFGRFIVTEFKKV